MLARVDSALGVAYLFDEQPDKAAEALSWAVARFNSMPSPDSAESSRALSNLAAANWMLGNLEEAAASYRRLIEIKRASADRFGEMIAHSGLGNASLSMGDYQLAIEQYRLALRIARELANAGEEAQGLNSMGYANFLLGRDREALDYYRDALKIWRALKDRRGEAMTLNNVGWLYRGQQDWKAANEVYQQALKAATESGGERDRSYILHGLGEVRLGLGDAKGAMASFEQSLTIKRKQGDLHGEAFTLALQAEACLRLGDISRARQLAGTSLEIRNRIADRSGQAASLGTLAKIERAAGDRAKALQLIAEAAHIVEGQRASIASIENRATFFATSQKYFHFWIELLLEGPQADAARALEINERRLARALRDRLWEDREIRRSTGAAELADSIRSFDRKIEGQAQRLQSLVAQSTAQSRIDSTRKRMIQLISERDALESRLASGFESPEVSDWSAEQFRRRLPRETAAVAYAIDRDKGRVWWIDRERIRVFETPAGEVIARAVGSLARASDERSRMIPGESYEQRLARLKQASGSFRAAAGALSKALLGSLPLGPQIRRLVITADGDAARAPFSALPHPSTGRPLIESLEIEIAPSLSWRQPHVGDRGLASAERILVVAAPEYDGDQSRWPRLPFAGDEARNIAAAAGGRTVKTLSGPEATLSALHREPLNLYSLLHLAAHAEVDLEHPALGGIVLAPASILRLYQIASLKLDARLVVLSACRTADGASLPGEGVMSLTRAFLASGARRVIATLWQVPDRSTAVLMKYFYDGLLRGGLTPSAALRTAQLRLRAQPQWQDPYFWSPFAVFGGAL